MKESNFLVDNAAINFLQREIFQNTKKQCDHQFTSKRHLARYQKAVHEGVKHPCGQCGRQYTERELLLNTKRQYMKESNTLANIAAINLLQREVLLNT